MNTTAIIGAIVLGSLAACGGGSSGGTTTFTTSVPGSTRLNQVSGTQLDTLCNDVYTYATAVGENVFANQTLKHGKCTALGYDAASATNANAVAAGGANAATDAELQSACNMEYNQCLQLTVSPTTRTCFRAPSASCTATVSQYETCVNDVFVAAEAVVGTLPSCSSITTSTLPADVAKSGATTGRASWAATGAPSCATFIAACSDVGDLLDPSLIAPYSL
jgi:hypothetical protein